MKINPLILLSFLAAQALFAGEALVPGDETYYKQKVINADVEMIHTKQNSYAAQSAASLEPVIEAEYREMFGWELDDTLHVGILSQRRQEANGFSTPIPTNLQMNFIGGATTPDYFTSTSWLHTLLYHETAHNYQLDVKASSVSRGLHSVFSNNVLPLAPFPLFVIPNAMLTSFTLEGNAVLNEAWHDNGGRLYNGRMHAMAILQARAGNINPSFLFNDGVYDFPYGERVYMLGGGVLSTLPLRSVWCQKSK